MCLHRRHRRRSNAAGERSDFRHPALRLTSLRSCRSRSIVDACHLQHADFSEHNAPREPAAATRAYFVPSGEEVSHPIVDVIVNGRPGQGPFSTLTRGSLARVNEIACTCLPAARRSAPRTETLAKGEPSCRPSLCLPSSSPSELLVDANRQQPDGNGNCRRCLPSCGRRASKPMIAASIMK